MFDRIKPCESCPFRLGGKAVRHLGERRALEIAATLEGDKNFTCHGDLDKPEAARQHCVGAMHILEADDNPNQMMRVSERRGLYDRTALVGADECFDNFEQWVEAQSDGD